MPSNLWLLVFLTCAVESCRASTQRTMIFEKSNGWSLQNHVISSHNVTSGWDCAFKCLETSGCKSYNYQETGTPPKLCELNNQSRSWVPSDYVIRPGFMYYDAEQPDLFERTRVSLL